MAQNFYEKFVSVTHYIRKVYCVIYYISYIVCILIIVLGWLMDYQQLSNTGEAALPYWNNLDREVLVEGVIDVVVVEVMVVVMVVMVVMVMVVMVVLVVMVIIGRMLSSCEMLWCSRYLDRCGHSRKAAYTSLFCFGRRIYTPATHN